LGYTTAAPASSSPRFSSACVGSILSPCSNAVLARRGCLGRGSDIHPALGRAHPHALVTRHGAALERATTRVMWSQGSHTYKCTRGRRRHQHMWQETTPAHVAGDDTSTRGRRRHQHTWQETTPAHVAGDDTSTCGRRRHQHTWQETTPAHVAGDDTSTRGRRRHQHAWSAG
jgi:hypothetical protein